MKYFKLLLLLLPFTLFAGDGVYVGAEVGYVGLSGSLKDNPPGYSDAIGFGIDLGIRTSSSIDVVLNSQYSQHGNWGGLSLFAESVAANFHLWDTSDFDVTLGGGPGFYFFKNTVATNAHFGLNLSAACDVKAGETFRIGLGTRYHFVFGDSTGSSFGSMMMRVGFLLGRD